MSEGDLHLYEETCCIKEPSGKGLRVVREQRGILDDDGFGADPGRWLREGAAGRMTVGKERVGRGKKRVSDSTRQRERPSRRRF